MARRIRIKRNPRPAVLRNAGAKIPVQSSHGAGQAESTKPVWCMWCYYPKSGPKAKCEDCGSFGSTSVPQKAISQVYLEDIAE